MLKLAALIDNPGEPLPRTRYRDAKHLARLGYNGLVVYESTSLSGVASPDVIGAGEMRRWVEQKFESIGQTIDHAHAAGLKVFISYDALTLARHVVERDVTGTTCRNRPSTVCPASETAMQQSTGALEALLQRWPNVAGVVLRFGDTDAQRFPYLVGNDVYTPHCPRCSSLSKVDRIVDVINRFYAVVVDGHDRTLIARAWNVRPKGLHDDPVLAEEVAKQLPGKAEDERLTLSFKFTDTDFWRYQQWNQSSLHMGGRPVIYELQCQREFEGKGGVPNWQPPLWRDGSPEIEKGEKGGLASVKDRVNLAGLWAWVRGGGWGGPFVSDEAWIDANVVAVPTLADDPSADVEALAQLWIGQQLGETKGKGADALRDILKSSSDTVLKAFYVGPFAKSRSSEWHPNGDWIQDDMLDGEAAWRMIQKIPSANLDDVVSEKAEAAAQISRDLSSLLHVMNEENRQALEPLANSLTYAESLYAVLRDFLAGLVAYRRWLKKREADLAERCQRRLMEAQSHWNHHTQRHATLHGAATAFRESNFWELTQRIIAEVSG